METYQTRYTPMNCNGLATYLQSLRFAKCEWGEKNQYKTFIAGIRYICMASQYSQVSDASGDENEEDFSKLLPSVLAAKKNFTPEDPVRPASRVSTTETPVSSSPGLQSIKSISSLSANPLEKSLESPLESPVESPLDNPLESPVESPFESPLDNPLESPVDSPLSLESPSLLSPEPTSTDPEPFVQAVLRRRDLTVSFGVTLMGYDIGVLREKDRRLYVKTIPYLDEARDALSIVPAARLLAKELFGGSEISTSTINRSLVFRERSILVPIAFKHARKLAKRFGLVLATKSIAPNETDDATVTMFKFSQKLTKSSRRRLYKTGKKWAKRALGALMLFVMLALFVKLQQMRRTEPRISANYELENIDSEEPLQCS
jgi:hypothetical protein